MSISSTTLPNSSGNNSPNNTDQNTDKNAGHNTNTRSDNNTGPGGNQKKVEAANAAAASGTPNASTDLATEFKNFVTDIENLLKTSTSQTGDELAQTKIRMNQRISAAKQCITKASESMLDQARKTATRTNDYVHEKPWTAIGAGALVSFVLGLLVGQHHEENLPQ